ncbi:hypothetical protein AFLA_003194 [Aspergillus flavus NRRL3357]|nr:hypothetical protein AFLA_003194 [Aspergillus flavus NRRL3357]
MGTPAGPLVAAISKGNGYASVRRSSSARRFQIYRYFTSIACSTMRFAIRSLTERPALKYSSFAQTMALIPNEAGRDDSAAPKA